MTFILPVTAALPLVFAEALAYIAFSACLGLTLGVARANLTWTSELMPIKQSLAVTIALFGGWLYAIVFAALYLWQGKNRRAPFIWTEVKFYTFRSCGKRRTMLLCDYTHK